MELSYRGWGGEEQEVLVDRGAVGKAVPNILIVSVQLL